MTITERAQEWLALGMVPNDVSESVTRSLIASLLAEVERLERIIQLNKTHQMFADLEEEYALVRDNLCKVSAELSKYSGAVEVE